MFPLFFCFDETVAANSPRGHWEPSKDEKCFKIFDSVALQTYEDAKKTCQLVLVNHSFSLEEQNFFSCSKLTMSYCRRRLDWSKNDSNQFKW